MTKEEFLKKIESLDKKQGNYKDTTQVMAKGKKYRKDVFKNSKKNERDKMLAELVQRIIDDNKPKGKDYIQNIVKDINLIFNH